MNRRAALVVVAGAFAAVLFAAVATSGEVKLAERAPSIPWEFGTPGDPDLPVLPDEPAQEQEQDEITPLTFPRLVTVILGAVLVGCLGALIGAVAVYAWRHRPRLDFGPKLSADFDVLDDVAASVTADGAEQFAALGRGAPRNAIVACWSRLETVVVGAYVEHSPADTSAELTERLLSRFAIDESAITDLAALYREARFSDHRMDESARLRAIDALEAVHDGLRERPAAAEATR